MYKYNSEASIQLKTILEKSKCIPFLIANNYYYFRFVFKREYSTAKLQHIINDPNQFEQIIYKDIRENLSKGLKLRNHNDTRFNLNNADGSIFLQNLDIYCYKNNSNNQLLIFLITNRLNAILQNDQSLTNYAYIFTNFYYNAKGDIVSPKKSLHLFLHTNLLKTEEIEKHKYNSSNSSKIISDLYIGI